MVGGDQEAEGGGTSTARLLSRQARCVLTLLCRVRLLTTTVVLGSTLHLGYSLPLFVFVVSTLSSQLSFPLFSSFLTPTFFLFFLEFLCLPPLAHPLLVLPHFQRTLLTHSPTILLLG